MKLTVIQLVKMCDPLMKPKKHYYVQKTYHWSTTWVRWIGLIPLKPNLTYHWSTTWVRWISFIPLKPYFCNIKCSVISHICQSVQSGFLHGDFVNKSYMYFPSTPCVLMPHPSHPPWLNPSNNISGSLQVYIILKRRSSNTLRMESVIIFALTWSTFWSMEIASTHSLTSSCSWEETWRVAGSGISTGKSVLVKSL